MKNQTKIILVAGVINWGEKLGKQSGWTQTSFVQSMMARMIGQHLKLTGGKGIIAVWDLVG